MLVPIPSDQAATYQRTGLVAKRDGSGLPRGLKIVKLLGKGSNNAVYLARTSCQREVVVREPRSNSDTQRIGNASWEFRNAMVAAEVGAGPVIYDAWYTRHRTDAQKAGLHVVCEYFPYEVHDLLMDEPAIIFEHWRELQRQTLRHLRRMADATLFCYDLKPSNMVASLAPLTVKFVDFGRDFTEWRPYSDAGEFIERAPVCSALQRLVDAHTPDPDARRRLYRDVMYYAMIVLLSSNISFTVQQSAHAVRASFEKQRSLNFMAEVATEARKHVNPECLPLIKEVLRHRDVRDTLRHYMGRRNCGTKRAFTYACFRLTEPESTE